MSSLLDPGQVLKAAFDDSSAAIRVENISGGSIGSVTIKDGITTNVASVAADGSLKVDASSHTQPISAVSLPLPSNAAQETGGHLASIDTKVPSQGQAAMVASLPVVIASNQSAIPASQSGTWNINNVSGTVSLPTGASTSAKQPALGIAGSASADVITVQGIASMTALKVDGSNVTQPVSGTITSNIGTTNGLALDATVSALQVSQASTTSGQKGNLIQGAVTTSSPSYTTAQTSPLSLTTSGALRVDASSTTQPVSGTVTSKAGTPTAGTITASALTVGTSAIRLTVSGSAPSATRSVLIASIDSTNTGKFYVGPSGVANSGNSRGIQLVPGQSFTANNDAGDYYIISDTASQIVEVLEQA